MPAKQPAGTPASHHSTRFIPLACRFFLILALYYSHPGGIRAEGCGQEYPLIAAMVGGYFIEVEIAATADARRCGLSFRDQLDENHGMLFIYNTPQPLAFWMKDTRIPLSIAFLDANGRILNIEQMVPFNIRDAKLSSGPARFALEMSNQWFQNHQVKVGDQVMFDLPAELVIE